MFILLWAVKNLIASIRCHYFEMSESPVKRLKGSPAAHQIPFDILCLIAQAGGPRLAVDLATMCRAMKRRIDERYEVSKLVDIKTITNVGERRTGIVGKFTSLQMSVDCVNYTKLKDVRKLILTTTLCGVKIADIILPPGLIDLTMRCVFDNSVNEMVLPECLQHLNLEGEEDYMHSFLHPINGMKLPPSLKSLVFGRFFNQSINRLQLPDSLQKFDFGCNFKLSF